MTEEDKDDAKANERREEWDSGTYRKFVTVY